MTDKEKMLNILENCNGSFEQIIYNYLDKYYEDFDTLRLHDFINDLNNNHLYNRLAKLENIKSIASERAFYIKTYLKGNMWKDEETAKRNLQPHIENAQ